MGQALIEHTAAKKIDPGETREFVSDRAIWRGPLDPESTTSKQERNFGKQKRFAEIALVVVFFVIVVVVMVKFNLAGLQALIAQHQDLALVISFSAIFVTGLTLIIPTAPVTLLLSLLIGPLPAIVITILGNILTALVHYQLGKRIGDVLNFEEKKARLPFMLGKLPVNSPLFLLVGRGLPGGPKGLSFVCGAYSVPLFVYVWTTFVAEIFGAVFVAYGGDQIIKLF